MVNSRFALLLAGMIAVSSGAAIADPPTLSPASRTIAVQLDQDEMEAIARALVIASRQCAPGAEDACRIGLYSADIIARLKAAVAKSQPTGTK